VAATLTVKGATANGCTAVLSAAGHTDQDVTSTTGRGCVVPPPSTCGLPCMGFGLAVPEPGVYLNG
jgi:hypothetical protein